MPPIRVMIVDDSKIFCQMLKDDLEKFLPKGSEITIAHDAIAAWAQLISVRPRVILLDEGMPRMDGAHFLRWLQSADISSAAIRRIANRHCPPALLCFC